jgi:Derlin-2/3
MLEEGGFRGRITHFFTMLLFGVTCMTAIVPFVSDHFLGSSLSFMVVYVWGHRNEDMCMSFLGVSSPSMPPTCRGLCWPSSYCWDTL